MRKTTTAFAVIAAALMFSSPTMAQDHSRNWENGNVIATSTIHLKPGMFNAYINDLRNVWSKFLDQQIDDGNVVSYRILVNSFGRDEEPDLVLITEYANWAAFDLGADYFDEVREKIIGSQEEMRNMNLDREALRTLGGNSVYQEIKFTN